MEDRIVNKKHKKRVKRLAITGSVFAVLLAFYFSCLSATVISSNKVIKFAKGYEKVKYDDQLIPQLDENNNYYFKTDRDLKIMQIADFHIGGGAASYQQDMKAINAVAAMVTYEKPDLVIMTGDQIFPVPFASLNNSNSRPFNAIASLFESLGVYWTATFGNHDSEFYSSTTRRGMASLYENEKLKYCIFKNNYGKEITGESNQIINIYNENGLINKTIYLLDSNDYQNRILCGLDRKYDNVHKDQIDWYEQNVNDRINYNNEKLSKIDKNDIKIENYQTAESFVFLHIPFEEYKIAYELYKAGDPSVKYNFGVNGEEPAIPKRENSLFETMEKLKSTKGVFCGHDHINNISLNYKGIDLTYGYSIDYIAYIKIDKWGLQRGCTLLDIKGNGDYEISHENYYQDKYVTRLPKEDVNLTSYYKE